MKEMAILKSCWKQGWVFVCKRFTAAGLLGNPAG